MATAETLHAEAQQSIRLGELRKSLGLFAESAVARVADTMPLYSDALRKPMDARRLDVAIALKVIGAELVQLGTDLLEKRK